MCVRRSSFPESRGSVYDPQACAPVPERSGVARRRGEHLDGERARLCLDVGHAVVAGAIGHQQHRQLGRVLSKPRNLRATVGRAGAGHERSALKGGWARGSGGEGVTVVSMVSGDLRGISWVMHGTQNCWSVGGREHWPHAAAAIAGAHWRRRGGATGLGAQCPGAIAKRGTARRCRHDAIWSCCPCGEAGRRTPVLRTSVARPAPWAGFGSTCRPALAPSTRSRRRAS